MSEQGDVRRYFSENARSWVRNAYDDDSYAVRYPVGAERMRLAIQAVVDRLGSARGRLVDLGCGGGDLCFEAAVLGFDATGIDIADGMIQTAESRRRVDGGPGRGTTTFRVADVLKNGLPAAAADAVTAIGLIEYLEDDRAFFCEAARLLRSGGVLVVSCRNRLFNMASVNDYTAREIERGEAIALLNELRTLQADGRITVFLRDFIARLREGLDGLEEALALDTRDPVVAAPAAFQGHRRQHTPAALSSAAAAAGFSAPAFLGVHPHFLPPAVEAMAPRVYNRLSRALEALAPAGASLGWSSAFLGVFTR